MRRNRRRSDTHGKCRCRSKETGKTGLQLQSMGPRREPSLDAGPSLDAMPSLDAVPSLGRPTLETASRRVFTRDNSFDGRRGHAPRRRERPLGGARGPSAARRSPSPDFETRPRPSRNAAFVRRPRGPSKRHVGHFPRARKPHVATRGPSFAVGERLGGPGAGTKPSVSGFSSPDGLSPEARAARSAAL
jgi:hypothetical protein